MSKKLINTLFVWIERFKSLANNANPKFDFFCRNCNKRLSEKFIYCPYCNFRGRDIRMLARDVINVGESSFKMRAKRRGFPKFVYELVRRYKSSVSKNLPEGVYENRVINKEKNLYDQTVYKVIGGKIGRVMHKEKEKLSRHQKT